MKTVSLLLVACILAIACNLPEPSDLTQKVAVEPQAPTLRPPLIGTPWTGMSAPIDTGGQISQYIRRVFEDSHGNLWFGTNGDGVCRKDKNSLTYFSIDNGFAGNAVRGILEDESGDIWFATDGGVSRYNGLSFINYTTNDGLSDNDIWSIFRDHAGDIWVGSKGGVSRHSRVASALPGAKMFSDFPLPAADIAQPDSRFSPKLVWAITEDKLGNLWFGTDGVGVRKYDGKKFTVFTDRDGLSGNNVGCILADRAGNMWFGTQDAGLSRYDGRAWTTFAPEDGLCHNFVWTLAQDKADNIWIGTAGGGTCRYDGKAFTSYAESDGLPNRHVQSILEDKNGRLWFGTSGGLFRREDKTFVNITKEGPW